MTIPGDVEARRYLGGGGGRDQAGRRRRLAALLGGAAATLALAAAASCSRGGEVELTVTRDGFEPALVRVAQGRPVTLVVTRLTDETCATEIVIPEAGVNAPLPLREPVRVTFTPARSGRLRYSCAMGMFGGVIEVR